MKTQAEALAERIKALSDRLDNEQRLQQRDKQIAAMKERIAELERAERKG